MTSDKLREEEYYVRDVSRGYLGNSPVWWAVNDQGYTAYLSGAKRFTAKEAMEATSKADDLQIYRCAEIDKRAHLVFDMQDFGRLGTDEPCPWRFGYATRAADEKASEWRDKFYIAEALAIKQGIALGAADEKVKALVDAMKKARDEACSCNGTMGRCLIHECYDHCIELAQLEGVSDDR